MPYAGVIFGPDGKLYGTAETGGPCNCGSAFSLTPPASKGGAWTADVIHAFTGQPTLEPGDGANPYAPLVLGTGGDLYGATQSGGICCGIIFKLNPPAFTGEPWTLQKLYGFSGYQDDGVFEESPVAIGKSGELYGVTSGGGYDAHGLSAGVVFDITPPSSGGGYWGETVTHDFGAQPIDGDSPYDRLVIAQSGVLTGPPTTAVTAPGAAIPADAAPCLK